MFLVQALFADIERKWQEVETFKTREEAEHRINVLRCEDACYLVELWQQPECYHAVG